MEHIIPGIISLALYAPVWCFCLAWRCSGWSMLADLGTAVDHSLMADHQTVNGGQGETEGQARGEVGRKQIGIGRIALRAAGDSSLEVCC